MILRVIKEILKYTWPLINDRKIDLTLKTAHAKVRLMNTRVGKLFRNKVKSMAIGTLNVHGPQRVGLNRLRIWSATRRNTKWRLRIIGIVGAVRRVGAKVIRTASGTGAGVTRIRIWSGCMESS